jgi:glycosyltransferase involved in cell wall biosynthesis
MKPALDSSDNSPRGLSKNGREANLAAGDVPVVSIITVVRNGERQIEETILSVLRQTFPNIEYIVIDGGSTDGTVEIIRKYSDKIAYWVSEPDNGISDAFNKGIGFATGEFIGILNADDRLSPDQIEQGVMALRKSNADFVFGDLLFHDEADRIVHRINGNPAYAKIIRRKMPELCHPTVLARRSAYERIGLFDTSYRYAMDYEWVLRLHVNGGTGLYVKDMVGHMGLGGASDVSYLRALREVRDIAVRYGRPKWLADCEYRYRVLKGGGRRFLERNLPKALFHPLRNLFNPRYTSTHKNERSGR